MKRPRRPGVPGPLPEPLRGSEAGSFAEDTLSRRLPEIAQKVLDDSDWHPDARRGLEALIAEMPHGKARRLNDPGAPDLELWDGWIAPYIGQPWLEAPWFPMEVYFFRRVLEATGYFQPGPGQGVDPYGPQKRKGLEATVKPLAVALDGLEGFERRKPEDSLELHRALVRLLHTAVWGNQADLSIWPAGSEMPETPDENELAANLLVDDAEAAVEYLLQPQDGSARIDFLLDNGGLELGYDLIGADILLGHALAQTVIFHAKPHPTYVSDVTIPDVYKTLDFLVRGDDPGLRELAQRLHGYLQSGRLRLAAESFWVSPLPIWEMPADLYVDLAKARGIISKGDANYRRWLNDLHWPFTTSFEQITAYRPAPLLALRVMKSNVIAGLPGGREEELNRQDPDWLYNGNWGVIQFAK